ILKITFVAGLYDFMSIQLISLYKLVFSVGQCVDVFLDHLFSSHGDIGFFAADRLFGTIDDQQVSVSYIRKHGIAGGFNCHQATSRSLQFFMNELRTECDVKRPLILADKTMSGTGLNVRVKL